MVDATDPVDAWVVAHDLVVGVDHDHLKVLKSSVLHKRVSPNSCSPNARIANNTDLVDPVAVQNAQVRAAARHTLLGHAAAVALRLDGADTLVLQCAQKKAG